MPVHKFCGHWARKAPMCSSACVVAFLTNHTRARKVLRLCLGLCSLDHKNLLRLSLLTRRHTHATLRLDVVHGGQNLTATCSNQQPLAFAEREYEGGRYVHDVCMCVCVCAGAHRQHAPLSLAADPSQARSQSRSRTPSSLPPRHVITESGISDISSLSFGAWQAAMTTCSTRRSLTMVQRFSNSCGHCFLCRVCIVERALWNLRTHHILDLSGKGCEGHECFVTCKHLV